MRITRNLASIEIVEMGECSRSFKSISNIQTREEVARNAGF